MMNIIYSKNLLSLRINDFLLRPWLGYVCQGEPVFSYVLGILLCIGGMISYFPQYYNLIKTKQHQGISEFSLLLLNIGSASLAANSFILNWWKFECYHHCDFWICSANLLSMFQITVGWLMVFPLYMIFVRYKVKNSERKIIYDIAYAAIYILFVLIMIIVGLAEKLSPIDSSIFFVISAKILGIFSAVCSSLVWLPQIIKLLRTKKQGNLSLLMFIMQTPGNAIIIFFQIIYHQNWTTWITYLITLIEQSIIVIILLIFMWRDRNQIDPDLAEISKEEIDDDKDDDTSMLLN
jgi:uncharacterized protein with PQ loop repeat